LVPPSAYLNRSNRTIVGLKRGVAGWTTRDIHRSNRTIVGLKRFESVGFQGGRTVQQSHHCGIETYMDGVAASGKGFCQQQSHHCGIETFLLYGIKLRKVTQQSHHCGIETELS